MSATDQPSALASQLDARRDRLGAERYRQRQRDVRRGRPPTGGAHPLEYDENGFPLPQRNSSFIERVARLLNPL
jgi:hypothetical protein